MKAFFYVLLILVIACCIPSKHVQLPKADIKSDRYNVAFLIMDGVYNTELTAPYDIFQHTTFRQNIKSMNTFLVADKSEAIRSFEGIHILPHYNFQTDQIPKIDILVVPSAQHHVDSDMLNETLISWVNKVGRDALFVTSHCDGAFILAKAGLLDDKVCTTFPADVELFRQTFPKLDVRENTLFVHDRNAITSAGGAKSFEAALYLVQELYGTEIARDIAKGLVIDWDLTQVNHVRLQ